MVQFKDNPRYKRVSIKDKNGKKRVVYVLKKRLKGIIGGGRSTYKPKSIPGTVPTSHIRRIRRNKPPQEKLKQIFKYNNRLRRYQQSIKPQIHNTYIINCHGRIDDTLPPFELKKNHNTIMLTKYGCLSTATGNDILNEKIKEIYMKGLTLYKENDNSPYINDNGKQINAEICSHICGRVFSDKTCGIKCLNTNLMTIQNGRENNYINDLYLSFDNPSGAPFNITQIVNENGTIQSSIIGGPPTGDRHKLSDIIGSLGEATYIVITCRLPENLDDMYRYYDMLKYKYKQTDLNIYKNYLNQMIKLS